MIGINKRTALKMFWDAGFNTESKLIEANGIIEGLNSPSKGYYYANDVVEAIESN